MIKTLHSIPWDQLYHAYGNAEDVPDLIEQLQSQKAEERREAIQKLYKNIYHQGTIYEATGYAIPFLVELLKTEKTADKDQIFWLIGSIYDGHYRRTPTKNVKIEIEKEKYFLRKFYQDQLENNDSIKDFIYLEDFRILILGDKELPDIYQNPNQLKLFWETLKSPRHP